MRTATVTIAIVALRRDVNGRRVNSPLKVFGKVVALVAEDRQFRSVVDPRGMVSAYSVRGAVDVPLGQWLRRHLLIGWRRFIRALTDTMRRPAQIFIMRRSTTSEMTMTQR